MELLPATRPPKFIIITHEFAPFRGGAATYVEEVAAAMNRAGATVEVWAPDYGGRAAQENGRCPVVRLRAGGSLRLRHTAELARALAAHRSQLEQATVILASVGAHMAFMWRGALGRLRCGRMISVLYGSEVLRFEHNPLRRWLARRLFTHVTRVVTISEFSRSLIQQSFLAPWAQKIVMAPCACSSVAARSVITQSVDDGKVRVLTLARLHPRKGQLDTARALGRLPLVLRQRIVYQVGGTGDAKYLEKIKQACDGAEVTFEYLGEIEPERVAAVYAQCDIFSMTSRVLTRSVEGFGIAYLEAGFHGKPVVGYRSGGAMEAVLDGETGLLVEEGNIEALADIFGRLIMDEDLRGRLGAGGRKQAARLSWATTACILQDL